MFGLPDDQARHRFLDGAPADVAHFLSRYSDAEAADLIRDLGGHDIDQLLDAYAACDAVRDRPSVVFAYTVKGWGLPTAGNHATSLETPHPKTRGIAGNSSTEPVSA